MGRPHRFLTLAVLVLVGSAVACSDDDGGDAAATPATEPATTETAAAAVTTMPATTAKVPATTSPPTTSEEPPATDTTVPAADEPATGTWREVVPGRDCACSDGSEFSFWVREADPDKVLFFLQGGGACWNLETCDPEGFAPYKQTVGPDDDPTGTSGIWDLDDPRNPLAEYSMVYVPYCTGDVHLGDTVTEYSDDVVIHHRGAVNGTAALDHLVETFPDASTFVVAGESAGSIPSPMYAGLLSDHYPGADITVLADGSGGYPDVAELNVPIGETWGVQNAIPDWDVNEGLTLDDWSIPGLFVQAGLHEPDITFARYDYAYDNVQLSFLGLTGHPVDDLLAEIDANEARIETDTGLEQHSYTAPGDDHTLLSQEVFYEQEVDGVALVDWVTDLVAGERVPDVRCTDCAP